MVALILYVKKEGFSINKKIKKYFQHLLNTVLKKIILFFIISVFSTLQIANAERLLKQTPKIKNTIEMYEQKNLASCSLFAGGFINFGYWDHPLKSEGISVEQRVESQKNLYRFILKKLMITKCDTMLEVGVGQGVGAALVLSEFHPKALYGIDFSGIQINRARKICRNLIRKSPERLVLRQGLAEKIPYENNNFDIVFSIESAQHFTNVKKFVDESFRVLKPNGTLAISTFFATSEKSKEPLIDMIQTARDGIDFFINIKELRAILKKVGFKRIEVIDISKNVWPGFDKWISQGEFRNTWNRNWYKAHMQGLVGYYVVIARK